MSKFRVEYQRVIAEGGTPGTIRWQLIAQRQALGYFSTYERNAIVREGMRQGGLFWLNTFFPQRFTDYAKRLGYAISMKYWKRKRKLLGGSEPQPLVFTGTLAETAMAGARVTAAATAKKQEVTIALPTGHPIALVVSRVMRTVPDWEIKRIAQVVGETIVALIQDADRSQDRKYRLTIPQRVRLDRIRDATLAQRRGTQRSAA